MIELPKGWRGSPKAVVLAGILWSCALHLGAAQRKVSVILEPSNPQVERDVTLTVREGPQQFRLCEWSREARKSEPEVILEYIPGQTPQEKKGKGHSGRETVRHGCSLHITNLRPSDTGNYSVIFESQQQSGQRPTQQPDAFYEGSVYLEVSASKQITVVSEPQRPNHGEDVTLTPQGTPDEIVFCEWFRVGSSGDSQSLIRYSQREQEFPYGEDPTSSKRLTVGPRCSLRMRRVTTTDSGTYSVKIQVPLDRQQQQPGQGSWTQEPDKIQEYWGQIKLQVNQDSTKDSQKGGAAKLAGLSYSVGMAALLVFFAWTDTFTSLFHAFHSASPAKEA